MPADPIPSDIAARWRPMWHPNAYLPRPWWRVMDTFPSGYVRVDGWRVERTSSGGIFNEPPGDTFAEMPGITFLSDGLAYVDAASPLPAPDPMPGQVWFMEDRAERVVVFVTGYDAWFMVQTDRVSIGSGDFTRFMHPELVRANVWPPPGAVLVAGPTPWGRDVPWAPMGGA